MQCISGHFELTITSRERECNFYTVFNYFLDGSSTIYLRCQVVGHHLYLFLLFIDKYRAEAQISVLFYTDIQNMTFILG